jgi:hypothetical protein
MCRETRFRHDCCTFAAFLSSSRASRGRSTQQTFNESHERFEQEYQQLYTKLLAGCARARSSLDELRAQVLSAAIEGVIHNAARRGTVGSPALELELVSLVTAYLKSTNGGIETTQLSELNGPRRYVKTA